MSKAWKNDDAYLYAAPGGEGFVAFFAVLAVIAFVAGIWHLAIR